MSGGSFNYVCYKLSDDLRIFSALDDLRDMEDYLRALGKIDAADELGKAVKQLENLQQQVLRVGMNIYDLTRAVEWWVSADGDEEDIQEALEEMNDQTNRILL